MLNYTKIQFMKKITKIIFIYLLIIAFPFSANAFEILGYVYRSDSVAHVINDDVAQQNASIISHIQKINIIAPQAYQVNEKGVLWGVVDPQLFDLAKKNHLKIMPLVTNVSFDSGLTHQFLTDQVAQQRAIQEMLTVCKTKQFSGLQIDFEHIMLADKDAYTSFYQALAKTLHENGFLISVTIYPRTINNVPTSDLQRSRLEYWSGGYDYVALGKVSDFVTLMAYDQHGAGTTPGSACEPSWAQNIISYALNYIPAEKISLGLPVHSSYWYTGFSHKKIYVAETDLTYPQVLYLLQKFHAHLLWDNANQLSYAVFNNDDDLNEYIFPEDARSFQAKLALVKKYKLRGVSLWHLGAEDPQIWQVLGSAT